jgi:aryl-alcohol dehydrogenase-like predicted oxidoreductase
MLKSKICLGTANFAKKYGIKKNKIDFSEITKIIKFASKKNIYEIDTAISYDNLNIINRTKISLKKFKINTKISLSDIKKYKIKNSEIYFKNILKKSGFKKFNVVSLHNFLDLKSNKGKELYKDLIKLREKGIIKKIGISLYNINEIDYLVKRNFVFDVLQFPVNFFDRRFLNKKIVKYFAKNNIETHARSIFLQGLLTIDPKKKIPEHVINWSQYLHKWDLKNPTERDKITSCISFVMNQKFINKIVIGIDSLKHLQYLISLKKTKFPKKFKNVNKLFYQPNLWKI